MKLGDKTSSCLKMGVLNHCFSIDTSHDFFLFMTSNLLHQQPGRVMFPDKKFLHLF